MLIGWYLYRIGLIKLNLIANEIKKKQPVRKCEKDKPIDINAKSAIDLQWIYQQNNLRILL